MAYIIPTELIEMVAQKRVIPFLGAGFSRALNFPDWTELLRDIASNIDSHLTFDDVQSLCHGDPLQIAEYYYLKSDRNIGPLRHSISKALSNLDNTTLNPLLSGAHVELVNLGSSQVYTTNYDDLIENTYRGLGVPAEVIALPKNVAKSNGKKVQVVKFHGDLRYENTLVLTESSYFSRLDFDSPMDIKFRSDLLGKSVLFMGYSFRDINIRVIWFKLMEMMKDIPVEDRPVSYIVRATPNIVLEELYNSVGIKTIVLDSSDSELTNDQMTDLLADFMLELVFQSRRLSQTIDEKEPDIPQFFSTSLYKRIAKQIAGNKKVRQSAYTRRPVPTIDYGVLHERIIPPRLSNEALDLLQLILDEEGFMLNEFIIQFALRLTATSGISQQSATFICAGLFRDHSRNLILKSKIPWSDLWSVKLDSKFVQVMLDWFDSEIMGHEEAEFEDHDIAYIVDLACRIKNGYICDDTKLQAATNELLDRATALYPSVAKYKPPRDSKPTPTAITREIDAAIQKRNDAQGVG